MKSNLSLYSIHLISMLWLSATLAFAQSATITDETLWLHKSDPNEEDISSRFPIMKSSDPRVAQNMNTVLQMETFGVVLNDKHKAALLASQSKDPRSRQNFDYRIVRPTARLIAIDIQPFFINNGMSLNGHYETHRYYFDANTGQQIHLRQLFTEQGFATLTTLGVATLRYSFMETMRRYDSNFDLSKENELNKSCECNCTQHLNNAFCSGEAWVDFSPGLLAISIGDCDWTNPGPHDIYQGSLLQDQFASWLTAYGKYILLDGEPAVNPSPFYKLWKGTLGRKIKNSFFLKLDCNPGEVTGLEVYDYFGTSIKLAGTYKNQTLIFSEIDDAGKAVATFNATLSGGKLVGTWTKADGSKTLTLEAVEN